MKHIFILGFLFFALRVDAAMVRVVDVRDGRTLVIERNGAREAIALAGLAIIDEDRAAELLRWTVVSTWVLLEPHPRGGHLAWRSPDALFVNRELVLRGYARATEHGIAAERNLSVTYLGTIDPPAAPVTRQPRTHSDTSRRPSASPSPRTRSAAPRRAGRSRTSAPRPR